MANKNFIEKFGNNNFQVFQGKSYFLRGYDKENPIVFIYDYSETDKPCGFVSITISNSTNELLEVKGVNQRDSCKLIFNKDDYYKMALSFLSYRIAFIQVDNNMNIFVKTKSFEGLPDLVKFIDPKYISAPSNYSIIKDNWYQRTK